MFEHTTSRKQASRLAPVDSSLFANGCVCCEIVLGFAGDLVIRKLSTLAIIVKSSSQVESYGYRSISKSHPIVQHEKACSDHVVAKMSQPSTLRLQQLVGRCCFCDGAARKNKSTLQSEKLESSPGGCYSCIVRGTLPPSTYPATKCISACSHHQQDRERSPTSTDSIRCMTTLEMAGCVLHRAEQT